MSGTEARTSDGETTGTAEIRDDSGSAAERLGGPIQDEQSLQDEQSRDAASEAETMLVAEPIRLPARASGTHTTRRLRPRPRMISLQAHTGAGQRTTLIEPERAESYNSRWNELKSNSSTIPAVPLRARTCWSAEVLDELEELFRSQRADLEHGLDSDQTSTEDLRQALARYRSFFDRLLTF